MENDQKFFQKVKKLFVNKHSFFLSAVVILCGLGLTFTLINSKLNKESDLSSTYNASSEVLGGQYYQTPQIYISGGENSYSSGGMIALASTDEPAVMIGGYNTTGDAQIEMYEANESALLDYLTHDKDGKQTKAKPDLTKFRFVKNIKQDINTSSYQGSKIPLPLAETGIWYLKVKMGKVDADAYIIRSNIGIVTKQGDDKLIYWGQNFKTKRSIADGTIKLLNLQSGQKELQIVSFNGQGIAQTNLLAESDIALVSQNEDRAIIPLNLKYLNTSYNYKQFQPKNRLTRYFVFTDRPLYKPGDTVYFKTVLRDDDDARYTLPAGEATVKIFDGSYYQGSTQQPIFEKNFSISPDGTISGQYQVPANGNVGYYSLNIGTSGESENYNNSVSFDVQFFRKPEFSIDVIVPQTEVIAADGASFKITGSYFSGQPMMSQKVKYSVTSSDFYEYQYLSDTQSYGSNLSDDYRYGYGYGGNTVTSGTATLDNNGEASISLDTKMNFNSGKTQIFSIEATIDDGSVEPSFARRNMLVFAGEYGIYRTDTSYGSKVNTPLLLPVALKSYKTNFGVAGINLSAKVHRENWVSFQEPSKKYPSYKKEEEDLPDLTAKTDSQGKAEFSFTPNKIGSYKITAQGKDSRGNSISKLFYAYVSEESQPYYSEFGNNDLTIATDKQKYSPTETVRFNIFSQIADRDILLSLERGRVNRFQVVHLNGKTGSVEIPLVNTDIPNIYASVSSFSSSALDSGETDVTLSSDSKKLVVNITPNSKTFGPGEDVTVNVSTTDTEGNPVSADLALWSVDKAIFELSDNKLGDIFETFWYKRPNLTQTAHSLESITVQQAEMGGGCFAPGTRVLMADGKAKNIEEVKVGDYVLTRSEKDPGLVKAKVLGTHGAEVGGYLMLNGNLKVTANHILWVNNKWLEAGSAQIGDEFTGADGKQVKISSIEWQRGKFKVYNLEIEKYHTYFAGGVWVHNQKGTERNAFKDTAYWNPSLHTDASGRAQVSFKLPDNLTTWTIAAVGSTLDTRVGQTTKEIVVSKDVIVRPILPNILRTGDEIVLSAIVQNFTEQDLTFDIDLKFDSGEVEDALKPGVVIKSKGRQQFYWKTKVTKENDKSKLVFSAKVKDNPKLADILTQEIPVRPFGFEEKTAQSGEGAKTFDISLSPDILGDKSSVTLALSPTILGTLPEAMKYLINYPYGCVEQTTSRFVPAVIAKANQGLFAQALKDKDIDDIIGKGLSRLKSLQQGDGGWGWWYSGSSDPYITSYVAEYLGLAQKSGVKVDQSIIDRAKGFLEQQSYYVNSEQKYYTREETIAKIYGLTVMGIKSDYTKQSTDLNNLSADVLSLAVMSNYLNGNTNPQTNGLEKLVSLAQTQGDSVFWKEGKKLNFGSNDASTSLAIRAILLAGGDRELAVKGARYLTRSRQAEYWSNTYATAQVVRAIVELSKTGDELAPNYNYSASLDGKVISEGSVTNSRQLIKDITLPLDSIKKGGSGLALTTRGEGQLYSTLLVNQFHTDRNAKALDNGLSVKREYVNEKGDEYSLGVGDTAVVRITVGGLKGQENYGVINDELPSGLVPINENFKNQQYGQGTLSYYTSYDAIDREITENGMVLSLYQIAPGQRTYTYRARVINEGKFIVPPATASLMYSPEINGRSEAQTVVIEKESKFTPKKVLEKTLSSVFGKSVLIGIGILVVIAGTGIFIAWKKRQPLS